MKEKHHPLNDEKLYSTKEAATTESRGAGGCLMLHICVLYRRGRDVAGSSRVTIITTSVFRVWVSRGLATQCRQLSVSVATVKYFSTTKNRNNFAQRK